jgi:hypothetical protein
MSSQPPSIFVAETLYQNQKQEVQGEYVHLLGEPFYKIGHTPAMPPFFMSLVSSSNHWMFISSTGGLSAGRINAAHALFPYYTVDKLTENSENTGPRTLLLVTRNEKRSLWEPFSSRQANLYATEQNLYKNIPGNVLIFEEVNHTLGLTFRYAWRSGDTFGFVKSSWLVNHAGTPCGIEVMDGLQNLLPANVSDQTQNIFSPLLDAYKRNELEPTTGLGLFTLNSSLTDLAEPSESLLATVAWQVGLKADAWLLTNAQLNAFRAGEPVKTEHETRGQRGAYFAHACFELAAGAEKAWHIVADVDQDAAKVVHLTTLLKKPANELIALLEADTAANTAALQKIVAAADGLQVTANPLLTAHHFANVMFNEMRGGYFPSQYLVEKADFIDFVTVLNRDVLNSQHAWFAALPRQLRIQELLSSAQASGNADLVRLSNSYLPLSFSRRHGDPSRPWNRFSINIKKKDGSQQLDYEGNWRDIFQNWEALSTSYPEYVESMIFTFLNATTVDGYNPYRVTRHGIDWEIPVPGDPWANIGYWSDHQIIYLLKLMEISTQVHPGKLLGHLTQPMFSYADVPYRINPYAEILNNPFTTISFDWDLEKKVKERVARIGNDGKLVPDANGGILHANLAEKMLTLLLAKLVNLVPEGGIWMTTQRPEWNDANNALVGKGISVVTLAYLRRYVVFLRSFLADAEAKSLPIHVEVAEFFKQVTDILSNSQSLLAGQFSEVQRRTLMDALGNAGSDYRWNFYKKGLTGNVTDLDKQALLNFLDLAAKYIDHSLRANRRADALYHSYNTLRLGPGTATVNHLYEMLEGQVAVLSSGLLDGAESLALLKAMRASALFRADQHSYILYPDRQLKGFVERNRVTAAQVNGLKLVEALQKAGDTRLLVRDELDNYHFAGNFRNVADVNTALAALKQEARFAALVEQESAAIEALFEATFQHEQFTGRSGTFFAFEGLGSIYWHMISKLLLAVQETVQRTQTAPSLQGLMERYADVRAGQCFNKTAAEYGAFPTDPYSHTPAGQGAKQPGMSGMVKEEILARQAELGYTVVEGQIFFDFLLFNRAELLEQPSTFYYLAVEDTWQDLPLPAGSLAYSICQVPVVIRSGDKAAVQIHYADDKLESVEGHRLDAATSRHIFERDGVVKQLEVTLPA